MLDAVDAYYAAESGGAPARRLAHVRATVDGARGATGGGTPGRALAANARLLLPNALEWWRSRLRSRAPVYTAAFNREVAFEGEVELNLHHGTVVVLGREHVDKFHLEDPEHFRALYDVVGPAAPYLQCASRGGVLRVRMPRFAPWPRHLGADALLDLAASPLAALHGCTPRAREAPGRFTLASKARQIFRFHRGAEPVALSAYEEMAERLEAGMRTLQIVLCHGDLWRGNLLRDQAGRPMLVDLDNALLAPASYDPVHLLLVHRSMDERADARRLLERLDEHGGAVASILKRRAASRGAFDPGEVRWSVLVYAFLKGAEWDARHGPQRSCLTAVRRAVEEVR